MAIRNSRFSIALVWAMIPLTVFGSIPRVGCICANGQHKFYCQRHLMQAGAPRCACCYGRDGATGDSTGSSQACRLGATACCGSNPASNDGKLPTLGAECPCRPVLDRPVFTIAVKAVLDLDQSEHAPLLLAVAPVLAVVPGVSFVHARGDVPPPPDLVTTLGVLLI
jgi:hypothetical protein